MIYIFIFLTECDKFCSYSRALLIYHLEMKQLQNCGLIFMPWAFSMPLGSNFYLGYFEFYFSVKYVMEFEVNILSSLFNDSKILILTTMVKVEVYNQCPLVVNGWLFGWPKKSTLKFFRTPPKSYQLARKWVWKSFSSFE